MANNIHMIRTTTLGNRCVVVPLRHELRISRHDLQGKTPDQMQDAANNFSKFDEVRQECQINNAHVVAGCGSGYQSVYSRCQSCRTSVRKSSGPG
ncbi:hypothetical protein EUW50_01115 [Salmonella enterica subsp. enterica serovar Hato]|nr:hypothetical protein [Salmonella enterica subsp. enterica serovar Hato]